MSNVRYDIDGGMTRLGFTEGDYTEALKKKNTDDIYIYIFVNYMFKLAKIIIEDQVISVLKQ